MNFYIRIESDEIIGYPMSEENLSKIIGPIDNDNLPADLLPVEKTELNLGVYEVYEGTIFEKQNNKVVETHLIRPMTDEEKTSRQDAVKLAWANTTNYINWIFSEEFPWKMNYVPHLQ